MWHGFLQPVRISDSTSPMSNGPAAVGIIMDGNRRWAKERGLPTLEGHRRGYLKLRELLAWSKEAGVEEVTVYAFSTENWKRTEEEVGYLMKLFEEACSGILDEFIQNGGKLRFIGDRSRFSEPLRSLMQDAEDRSREGKNGTLVVALSYGGRPEILAGVNAALTAGKQEVSEEEFGSLLWTTGLRDPDLIIRTGGDQRLSNFLTWSSVYSELFFVDTYWPDFSKEEFDSILTEYASRERRRGK